MVLHLILFWDIYDSLIMQSPPLPTVEKSYQASFTYNYFSVTSFFLKKKKAFFFVFWNVKTFPFFSLLFSKIHCGWYHFCWYTAFSGLTPKCQVGLYRCIDELPRKETFQTDFSTFAWSVFVNILWKLLAFVVYNIKNGFAKFITPLFQEEVLSVLKNNDICLWLSTSICV